MTRRLLLTLLPLLLSPALAHELVRSGNVGALLHIEPDDNPVTGKANPTRFEINVRGGKPVLLAQCQCSLQVYAGSLKAGAKPSSTPALRQAQGALGASLNFPKTGAYTLFLSGKPRPGAPFSAFKLSWVVRAEAAGSDAGGHDH